MRMTITENIDLEDPWFMLRIREDETRMYFDIIEILNREIGTGAPGFMRKGTSSDHWTTNPSEAQVLASGVLKWGGLMEVEFMERLYLGGKFETHSFARVLDRIYDEGKKRISGWLE